MQKPFSVKSHGQVKYSQTWKLICYTRVQKRRGQSVIWPYNYIVAIHATKSFEGQELTIASYNLLFRGCHASKYLIL